MSRIVHDHKGTAIVQWYDAPAEYDRPVLEIEDGRPTVKPAETGAKTGAAPNPGLEPNTGSLSVERNDDSNPGLLLPGADRKRVPGHRTDLRKLSAWIKLVRELEEAKKRKQNETEPEAEPED